MSPARLPFLGGVPDCGDKNAAAADAVENRVGSAADDEFTDAGFGAGTAQVGMKLERFNDGDDAGREAFRSARFIESDKGVDFAETGKSQRGPDDLYRHKNSSSWVLPQAHLGGGSSCFVPQESSQAFMSSCLT